MKLCQEAQVEEQFRELVQPHYHITNATICMASHLEQDYVLPTGFKEIFHQPARPGNPNQGKYFGDESSVNHNHVGKDGFRQHHQNFTKLSNGLSCGWERNKTSMEQECGGVNLDRKKQTHLEEPPATAEDSLLFVADYKRTEKAASSQEASGEFPLHIMLVVTMVDVPEAQLVLMLVALKKKFHIKGKFMHILHIP